jgi:two-component sensor histidine kinase
VGGPDRSPSALQRDAILVTELETGRVLAASAAALALFGRDAEDIVGRTTVEIGIWKDEGQRNSFLSCLEIEGALVRYPVRFVGAGGAAVEAFVAAERCEGPGGGLLVNHLFRDPFTGAKPPEEETRDLVSFLSRTATKFLVDEGSDLYRTIAQELRSLVPHSLVTASSYDEAGNTARIEAYSLPDDLAAAPAQDLPAIDSVAMNDYTRGRLAGGELFQIPLNGKGASAAVEPAVSRALKAYGAVSFWRIGLSWNGRVYGVVSLAIRPPDQPPDRAVVEAFVRQAAVALQRNDRSRALAESLHEKETLLREIHHRVKNNLQIVSSLLRLQTAGLADPASITVLAEAADRVQSMSLVHTMLYGNENLATIDAAEFIRSLAGQILRSGRFDASLVSLEFALQPIRFDPDHAIPVGLIVNELMTNALKYGVRGPAGGRIRVSLVQDGRERVLSVADSGGALPGDFDPQESRTLGMQLVSNLARQLGGKLSYSAGSETVFRVCFPV